MERKVHVAWLFPSFHACITHMYRYIGVHASCMHMQPKNVTLKRPGAELKKMFLESGGNFDLVELKAKQWSESKKTNTDLESRVTKRQLKEKYFWDDARAPIS